MFFCPKSHLTQNAHPPVSLSECMHKGLAEIVCRNVSKFLSTQKLSGHMHYLCEDFVSHCMSDSGSIDTACQMVRILVEDATASDLACVLVSTDLSIAFGSIDLDSIFPILDSIYRLDRGAAVTVAFTAKHRSQELKPLAPKSPTRTMPLAWLAACRPSRQIQKSTVWFTQHITTIKIL